GFPLVGVDHEGEPAVRREAPHVDRAPGILVLLDGGRQGRGPEVGGGRGGSGCFHVGDLTTDPAPCPVAWRVSLPCARLTARGRRATRHAPPLGWRSRRRPRSASYGPLGPPGASQADPGRPYACETSSSCP